MKRILVGNVGVVCECFLGKGKKSRVPYELIILTVNEARKNTYVINCCCLINIITSH